MSLDSTSPNGRCEVCRELLAGRSLATCEVCGTAHHQDCWDYVGNCSTYGCESTRFVTDQGRHKVGSLRHVVRSQLKSDGLGIDRPGNGMAVLGVAIALLGAATMRIVSFFREPTDADPNASFLGSEGRSGGSAPRSASGWLPAPDPILVPKGTNPDGYRTFENARDGSTMILIPEHGGIGPFLISQHEVTAGQYYRFAGSGLFKGREQSRNPNRPVVLVHWKQAQEYCAWVGGRLPTEAEWDLAARGPSRLPFPWGRSASSRGEWPANVGKISHLLQHANGAQYALLAGRHWNDYLAPVGSHPQGASPYGVLDMVGNVDEWCADDWEGGQGSRVTRGGSWLLPEENAGSSWRSHWHWEGIRGDLGFRVARDPPRGLLDVEQPGR